MFAKYVSCLAVIALLNSCNPKHPEGQQHAQPVDSVAQAAEKHGFLDLDVEQYEVYDSGNLPVVLPESDLYGVPREREADNILQTTGVTRSGDELLFTLKNGGRKVLKNNFTDADNTAEYIFMRSLDTIGHWEILAFYYESFDYILIDQNDGTETHIWNKAVLSPDNKNILCGIVDIEAGFVPNGFQLWALENGKLVLKWEKELTNWSAERLVWKKENEIWGEQTYRDNISGELKKRGIKMRLFRSDPS